VAQLDAATARAALAGRLGDDPALALRGQHANARALEQVLFGCSGARCRERAAAAGKQPFMLHAAAVHSAHDGMAKLVGPLPLAAMLAGNIILEYEQGLPLTQVGWGRLDHADALAPLFALRQAEADLVKRTPYLAAARSGNLLTWIGASLSQAANGGAQPAPLQGRPAVIVLVGHDTNLSNLQALLGLRWRLPEQPDPYAPGSAMVLSLYSDAAGDSVRAQVVAPTLTALRAGSVDAHQGMVSVPVFIPDCSKGTPGYPCPLTVLLGRIRAAVPPHAAALQLRQMLDTPAQIPKP